MGNDEDSDDSDSDYPYIVSTKWPTEYFTRSGGIFLSRLDLYDNIKSDVKQVILGTSVKDIFAKVKLP